MSRQQPSSLYPSMRLQDDLVHFLYDYAPFSMGGALAAVLALFVAMYRFTPVPALVWTAVMVAIHVGRILLARRFRQGRPEAGELSRWHNRFVAVSAVASVGWAVGVPLFLPNVPLPLHTFAAFIYGGLVASAAATYAASPRAFLTVAAGLCLPMILFMFLQGDQLHWLMGGMFTLFSAAMLHLSRQHHRLLVNTLNLRGENSDLVQRLTTAVSDAVNANEELEAEISERIQAGKQLREQKKTLQSILEHAPIGIWLLDVDGRARFINRAFCQAVGVSEQAFLETDDYTKLLDAETRRACKASDAACLAGDGVDIFHHDVLCADGERHPMEMIKVPLKDDAGQTVGLIGLAMDLTERQRMERNLRRVNETLTALFQASPIALFALDAQLKITDWNPAAERIFGWKRDEVLGEGNPIIPSGRHDEYLSVITPVLEGEAFSGKECVRQCRDGSLIDIRLSSAPLRDDEGRVVGVLAWAEDISGEKLAQEREQQHKRQMEHTQRLESLGVLAGGIAHDFNNILTAIMGNAQLAGMQLDEGSVTHTPIRHIETACQRASGLCKQMLAYAGKGKFLISPVSLSALVEDMAQLLEVSIPKKVALHCELAEELPCLKGDQAQLQQVVMNLITNAAEAIGDREGRITIQTGLTQVDRVYLSRCIGEAACGEGEYVYLEVRDTGCGIDRETQEKIFDPFFTTKFTGRGLGLSAMLGIVRGHDGLLMLDTAPGEGTTFRILFPADQAMESGAPSSSVRSESGIFVRGTMLVVDDEHSVRDVTCMMLERIGVNTLTADDGMHALEVFRDHRERISAVMLDMTMPRMGGVEAYEEMKLLCPDIKVLFTSGFSMEESAHLFDDGEGIRFIQKPFDSRMLHEEVHGLLVP